MLSNLPPDKGRQRISRGFAVVLIATSLITAASLAYLSRSSRVSLDEKLREPLPAPSPELIATAKIRADQRRNAAQKREHEYGLVIANGEIQSDLGTSSNVPKATLSKVVLTIQRLVSPAPNIKMLSDVGSLSLNNINMSWPSPSPDQLEAVLKALASSTGGQFTVTVERNENAGRGFAVNNHGAAGVLSTQSGPGPTYVLARSAMAEAKATRRVAVFNLVPQPNPAFAAVEIELRAAQSKLIEMSNQYLENHPLVIAARNRLMQLQDEGSELRRIQSEVTNGRVKEIRTILDVTLQGLGMVDRPTFRFHESSGLLVATGTDAALEVLGKIVTAMGGTAGDSGNISSGATVGLTKTGTGTLAPAVAANARYIVKSGDTLSGIASRYHTTVAVLMALNGNLPLDALRVGQMLWVPGDAPTTPIQP